ncbi:hypothetical protein KP77_12140 [Jeotgalibacillus alimentarius]|uniref:DUF3953 domain-containing protein n=1 Tax=Jeotgalibacillus alimentarius TaxID=135826 RepID=A0A0C2VRZ7_9BACL|nr:DUF3953 domain-containing protein [Jeotgalibacillus alimentarius]KIL51702.1 hypothetical protein KP77_12140 [Jeotgalibacillus alimentarius]
MNNSKLILGVILLILSIYIIITDDHQWLPFTLLLLGLIVFINGLIELRQNKKSRVGYTYIVIFLFVIYVAIDGILLRFSS